NDIGTQYRSGIYTYNAAQRQAAEASKAMYEQELEKKRYGAITTEIVDAPEFYFAEDYHQQYLAKNPFGYCGLGGTGVSCPIGTGAKLTQGASAGSDFRWCGTQGTPGPGLSRPSTSLLSNAEGKTWMPATSAGMTGGRQCPAQGLCSGRPKAGPE